jgi:hypothetical protein
VTSETFDLAKFPAQIDGQRRTVTLATGEAVINPPGAWHTADIDACATAVFVTAGVGTEVRPRD